MATNEVAVWQVLAAPAGASDGAQSRVLNGPPLFADIQNIARFFGQTADLRPSSPGKEVLTNANSYERIVYLRSVQGKKA